MVFVFNPFEMPDVFLVRNFAYEIQRKAGFQVQTFGIGGWPKKYQGKTDLPITLSGFYSTPVEEAGVSLLFGSDVFLSAFFREYLFALSATKEVRQIKIFKLFASLKAGFLGRQVFGEYVALNPAFSEKTSRFSPLIGLSMALKYRTLKLFLSAFPINYPDVGIVSEEKMPPRYSLLAGYGAGRFEGLLFLTYMYYLKAGAVLRIKFRNFAPSVIFSYAEGFPSLGLGFSLVLHRFSVYLSSWMPLWAFNSYISGFCFGLLYSF